MSKLGLQKAIVPFDDLPPVVKVGEEHGYLTRYRIVSESNNKQSHWSQIYFVPMSTVEVVSGALTYDFANSTITTVWDDVNNRPNYDVFVQFGYASDSMNSYFFHGVSPIHTYSFLRESGISGAYTFVRVRIQISSVEKKIDDALKVYESATIEIVAP